MKITDFLSVTALRLSLVLIALSVGMAGSAPAQESKIVFSDPVMTVSQIIETLERQTPYTFIYDASALNVSQRIQVPADVPFEQVLLLLGQQTGFDMKVRNRYVLVYPSSYLKVNPEPVHPRTSDQYAVSEMDRIDLPLNPREQTVPGKEEAVPEYQIVSKTETPKPYSNYRSPHLYHPAQVPLSLAAVKTNLLYGAAALTPNLAVELGTGNRQTLEIAVSHNRWNHKANPDNNDKLMHWIVRPEYRFWFCERFNGHFIGAHAFYSGYNISGKRVPLLFSKQYRYEGYALGAGISYGYHQPLARQWSLEFSIGIGAAYLNYDRYDCRLCDRNAIPQTKTYLGPTRAGISLVYLIK